MYGQNITVMFGQSASSELRHYRAAYGLALVFQLTVMPLKHLLFCFATCRCGLYEYDDMSLGT
jgi:hypothetical protein